MAASDTELYAGHDAWRNWFELCAVKKCRTEEQKSLARQITSSFTLALSRYGIKPSDFEREDLSDLFDIHFVLQGGRDGKKPLKQYYLARINKEDDVQLKKLVCGTFFSSKCGIIRDMARTVIPLIKGWMPHKIKGKIVWEAPLQKRFDSNGDEIGEIELSIPPMNPKEDPKVWDRHIIGIFLAIGGRGELDAPLLVYSIANGIRPYNATVWRYLGVRSVMANRRFHQALEAMANYMKRHRLTFENEDFVAALIAAATQKLGKSIVKELEGVHE